MSSSDITDGAHPSLPTTPPRDGSLGAETRPGHYLFAHYALRGVALNDPLLYLGILASPDAGKFLDHLLQTVVDNARPGDPPPDFTAADCRIHTVRAGVYPCAVVELPTPRAMTEAYFTAAVLLVDPDEEKAELQEAPVRYFTLEMGFNFDNTPLTILCEWSKDGSHFNFGPGPAADVQSFVGALCRLLKPDAK